MTTEKQIAANKKSKQYVNKLMILLKTEDSDFNFTLYPTLYLIV